MLPHIEGGKLLKKKKKKGSRPDEATLRVERGNSTELTSFLFLVCLYFFLCFGRQSHHGSDSLILLTSETWRVQLSLVIIRDGCGGSKVANVPSPQKDSFLLVSKKSDAKCMLDGPERLESIASARFLTTAFSASLFIHAHSHRKTDASTFYGQGDFRYLKVCTSGLVDGRCVI